MENIGAKTGYGAAVRLGEGSVVALVLWLFEAQDNDCPQLRGSAL